MCDLKITQTSAICIIYYVVTVTLSLTLCKECFINEDHFKNFKEFKFSGTKKEFCHLILNIEKMNILPYLNLKEAKMVKNNLLLNS